MKIMQSYELEVLPFELAVCRLGTDDDVPDWAIQAGFFSLTRTSDELSVVCPQDQVPASVKQEGGWRGLKVRGPLDFEQVGVLAALARPLAQAGVSIFAVSTYETDYILVRTNDLNVAVSALRKAGHQVQY